MKTKLTNAKTLLIIAFIGSVLFVTSCKKTKKEVPSENKEIVTSDNKENISVTEKKEDVKNPTVNVKNQQKITSPLLIEMNSKGLWKASEGEIGTVTLVDKNNNTLATGILFTSDDNWMTSGDAFFKTTLQFDAKKTTSGTLIFKNRLVRKKDIEKSFTISVLF